MGPSVHHKPDWVTSAFFAAKASAAGVTASDVLSWRTARCVAAAYVTYRLIRVGRLVVRVFSTRVPHGELRCGVVPATAGFSFFRAQSAGLC